MASHNNPQMRHKVGGAQRPPTHMIAKAVRYARVGLHVRAAMRDLLAELDRHAELDDFGKFTTPPAAFRAALRRPIGARRKPITVLINGRRVPLLLNPQGEINPAREQEVWDFVRTRLLGGQA